MISIPILSRCMVDQSGGGGDARWLSQPWTLMIMLTFNQFSTGGGALYLSYSVIGGP